MTTDGDALAAHLATLDRMERDGARLLDAGANPAKMAADLLCVILRLQCESRWDHVRVNLLEEVLGDIVDAQEDEAGL